MSNKYYESVYDNYLKELNNSNGESGPGAGPGGCMPSPGGPGPGPGIPPSPPWFGCFSEGTKVSMTDGTEKNIEDVKVGDMVKSFDEKTNKIKDSEVYETFKHENIPNRLLLNGIIKTTTNHPFYSEGEWIEAGDLDIGDIILHLDGTERKIDSIETMDSSETVYNFEVDTTHTYFAEGYLVHNKMGGGGGGKDKGPKGPKKRRGGYAYSRGGQLPRPPMSPGPGWDGGNIDMYGNNSGCIEKANPARGGLGGSPNWDIQRKMPKPKFPPKPLQKGWPIARQGGMYNENAVMRKMPKGQYPLPPGGWDDNIRGGPHHGGPGPTPRPRKTVGGPPEAFKYRSGGAHINCPEGHYWNPMHGMCQPYDPVYPPPQSGGVRGQGVHPGPGKLLPKWPKNPLPPVRGRGRAVHPGPGKIWPKLPPRWPKIN